MASTIAGCSITFDLGSTTYHIHINIEYMEQDHGMCNLSRLIIKKLKAHQLESATINGQAMCIQTEKI